jgi:predicted secreted protein
MPTFLHGKGSYFSITTIAGATVKMSSGLEEVSFPRSVDTAEVTTYGKNDRNFIAGLRSGTISVTGIFASTFEEKIAPLLGSTALTNFTFGPGSTATGARKEKGSAIVTSYEVGAPVGDKVSMKMSLQVTGTITSTKF